MDHYFETKLNRMIVDYLLREGFFESAREYVEQMKIHEYCDLDVFAETDGVLKSLDERRLQEGLQWCYNNRMKLGKVSPW